MLEIISTIVLMLLAMVSYASGITLAAKRREYPVAVVDLMVVVGLWLVLFWLRPQLTRLPLLGATILLGMLVGYIVGAMRLAGYDEAKELPKSELPEHARERGETAVPTSLFRRAWHRWNDFAGRMGNVQGRLLMGFFYFFIVTPFGLGVRLLSDPLAIKKLPTDSNWKPKEATELNLDAAKEQG
jgi:heme A synthase